VRRRAGARALAGLVVDGGSLLRAYHGARGDKDGLHEWHVVLEAGEVDAGGHQDFNFTSYRPPILSCKSFSSPQASKSTNSTSVFLPNRKPPVVYCISIPCDSCKKSKQSSRNTPLPFFFQIGKQLTTASCRSSRKPSLSHLPALLPLACRQAVANS
jgi:hypothetical protein